MTTKAKANRQRSLERSGSLERSSSVERGTLSRQGSTEKPSAKEPDEGITEDLDPTELKVGLLGLLRCWFSFVHFNDFGLGVIYFVLWFLKGFVFSLVMM